MNPLFLNPPESQEGETESAFNARTQQKHQQNYQYMMKIRQVGYNKLKMKQVSYPPMHPEQEEMDEEQHRTNMEDEGDGDSIDVG